MFSVRSVQAVHLNVGMGLLLSKLAILGVVLYHRSSLLQLMGNFRKLFEEGEATSDVVVSCAVCGVFIIEVKN